MEAVIIALVPALADYPFLLALAEMLIALFFGSFIFSAFWGMLTGFHK